MRNDDSRGGHALAADEHRLVRLLDFQQPVLELMDAPLVPLRCHAADSVVVGRRTPQTKPRRPRQ